MSTREAGRELDLRAACAEPFAKECDCVTHEGPHWLHMQLMDRAALTRVVREAGNQITPAFAHWAFGEAARLEGDMAKEMERRGIDVLPGAVVRRVRESHERWVAERVRKREAAVAKKRESAKQRLAEIAMEYETATTGRRREIEAETMELQRA